MNRVRVKICGLTRQRDVTAAVAAGADALGFVFTPRSKRFIEPEQAVKRVAEIPAFIDRVGLFMDQEAAEVDQVLHQVPLSLLQFHGNEDPAFCAQFGRPWIKAVSMSDTASVEVAEQRYQGAAALLLDSHVLGDVGGTGRVFDWNMVPRTRKPLILAGGLSPANVREAVRTVKPWAVDVSSGVEDEPGIKNADKIRQFIKEAKA